MKHNTVKHTLKAGGVALGSMVFEFTSSGLPQIAAGAGAEFLVFDMEHTALGIETIRQLLAHSKGVSTVPIVRVPSTEYHWVARCLDAGAMGIMVPMVESAEQAAEIVRFAKYPPEGRRGAAFGMAHDDYSGGDVAEKIRIANAEVLLIAQIETTAGLQNVDDIAAVPGLDVLWVGLYDLTNFLGIPGQMGHPHVDEAIAKTIESVKRHGKTAAVLVGSVEEGKRRLAQGFRCIAYSGDIWLYQRALAQGLRGLRDEKS
jgi:2-dehydro-3-deoxyglucarate aldolase/4-hydroxy-2-oxoheptanedioate aldolase